MDTKRLVDNWFGKWENGNYHDLPVAHDFTHTSPFGTISGKDAYIDIISKNESKFLGYVFDIHDALYENDKACVRYTAKQGEDFSLDVFRMVFFQRRTDSGDCIILSYWRDFRTP